MVISVALNITAIAIAGYFSHQYGGFSYICNRFIYRKVQPDYALMHYRERVDLFRGLPIDSKSIVMLGDSLTQAAEWNEFFPSARILNRGIGRDTTAGVLSRFDTYLAGHPRKLFLMIGINDLREGSSVPEIVVQYRLILDKLNIQHLIPCCIFRPFYLLTPTRVSCKNLICG